MELIRSLPTLPRRLLWKARIHRWNIGYPDAEMRFLPRLCNSRKTSLDIGAAQGIYVIHLLAYSHDVIAFEPRIDAVAELEQMFTGAPVKVYPIALSDTTEERTMVVCPSDWGRSTLEKRNHVAGVPETVSVRPLDDFELSDVGFIKIDVEGHEEAVLSGSIETLQRNRPNILIEIEEAHNEGSLEAVPRLLSRLQYSGWFFFQNTWQPLTKFNARLHQIVGGMPYINNFVFVPDEMEFPLA